ncbi:hypothetical protein WA026_013850, partial [Henosepilachna vigintioctopunctata]
GKLWLSGSPVTPTSQGMNKSTDWQKKGKFLSVTITESCPPLRRKYGKTGK